MYCIYRITNIINGHFYIGQHKYTDESNPMKGYFGSGMLLHKAYKKYGKESFVIKVLYSRIRDRETADAMEVWTISRFKPEYNIAPGGKVGGWADPNYYKTHKRWNDGLKDPYSDEVKKRISEKLKGIKRSEETKKKMGAAKLGNKSRVGKKLSEETKQKLRDKHIGRKHNYFSKGSTGMHWYNNGDINALAYECPEGFVKGRLTRRGI